MDELSGKVAIVTGAASGIGRAAAQLFATQGATLVLADMSAAVSEVADAIVAGDGQALGVEADAGDEDAVERLVALAVDRFDRLDICFANAGISGGLASIFEQSASDWAEILRINLIGPFLAIKHAGQAMHALGNGGSIICTASVAGLKAGAGGPAYSASKAGVISLVRLGAQQLSGSGIRVNAICPGLIQTGMTQPLYDMAHDAGRGDAIGRLNPLRRGGEAQEIAQAALFLASERSSYVNGHALVVDGGLTSAMPYSRQEFGKTAT